MKSTLFTVLAIIPLALACADDRKAGQQAAADQAPVVNDELAADLAKVETESDGQLPATSMTIPSDTQESVGLVEGQTPHSAQHCIIHLNTARGVFEKAWCRGQLIANWFSDPNGGNNSVRCAQRAAEWYGWCGIARRTSSTVWLQRHGNGAWRVPKNGLGQVMGGVYEPAGQTYYVPQ